MAKVKKNKYRNWIAWFLLANGSLSRWGFQTQLGLFLIFF
jgi:hypothetical protein